MHIYVYIESMDDFENVYINKNKKCEVFTFSLVYISIMVIFVGN